MIGLHWCRLTVVGLIVLQPLWFAWLVPPELVPLPLVLAASLLPLLAVFPGVWHLHTRTLVIAGCLLMVYFSFAVMEAWAHPAARGPALIQIALVTLFFIALPAVRKQSPRPGND